MTKLSSLPLLAIALAASCSMLTACVHSQGVAPPDTAAKAVVATKTETRSICPAELDQGLPAKPKPAAGAVVTTNQPGGEFLTAMLDWGNQVAALFNDAATDCHNQQAGSPP